MDRRTFLTLGTGTAAFLASGSALVVASAPRGGFEVEKTEEEWRALLTDDQFAVLRKAATERPFSSPLNDEERAGVYHCAGCDLPLFSSEAKFDSGTGWPSFHSSLPNAVRYKTDYKLVIPRTEEHCQRCGGHLGHVFNDGPAPTGKRHCINGVALTFRPSENA
ncbi:peptide-methionine (R)-S-oxide reductase MsrB [Oricola sp.]|uniref:peptide-methionine (R)-S-oxide reductase MsrB n=1 Tax=Oricola sp. TaxID=1979950 RepID=UPI003BAAE818